MKTTILTTKVVPAFGLSHFMEGCPP
jgi:hypothetical protein